MMGTQSLNLDGFECFSVQRVPERWEQSAPLAEPEVAKEEAPNGVYTRVPVHRQALTDAMQDARPVPAPDSSGVVGRVARGASVVPSVGLQ